MQRRTMTRIVRPLALLAAVLPLVLLLLARAAAAQGSPTVRGIVVDAENGGAVAGAVVSLGARVAITDQGGRFTFCRVPGHPPALAAKASGYALAEHPAGGPARDTALVRIALRRPSPGAPPVVMIRETWGTPAGPPLILLDGSGTSTSRTAAASCRPEFASWTGSTPPTSRTW